MSPKSLKQGNLSSPTMFLLLGFSSTYRAQVTLCLCFSLIYLVTVLGNLLIVTLVWLDAHLHSPMYFFLGHLSFLDICYSSVTLPKILGDSLSPQKTISFVGCITQIYFFLCFGGSECILLAAMAYDRYLAICHPLHYPALMSKKMCHCLVAISWLSGSFSSLIQAFLTACLPFCGSNMINHLFCEIPFLLKASCSPNALLNKAALYALAGTIAMGSFLLTLVSYVHIIRAVLQKGAGTQRAFATCTSHLTVVTLFFGTGAIAYLLPHSSASEEIDEVLALLYAVVTPMLNPIIYSLRNSEVKGAIRKALHREVLWMSTKVAGIVLSDPHPPHCRGAALGDPTHMNGSGTPGRAVPCGAGVLKMKVIFLLQESILLLMLQAWAKIPLKEYCDGEKLAGKWHTIAIASHSSSIKDLKKYEKMSVSTIFHHDGEIIIKTLIPGAGRSCSLASNLEVTNQLSKNTVDMGAPAMWLETSGGRDLTSCGLVNMDYTSPTILLSDRQYQGLTISVVTLYSVRTKVSQKSSVMPREARAVGG
ncbi:olfactory receptor 10A7-like [Harpia harpyja]|uniref:olfactory receptor 10A7-like n=1 Tax=Harpia harpyja TaxID=202280 RepID=UPI0022B17B6D|nr:olfactory receptor 10A7-like [Harpia harpyja]